MGELEPRGRLTLRGAFAAGASLLRKAGALSPELDARLLLLTASGLSAEDYARDAEARLDPQAAANFAAMIGRREDGEPVSRIIGRREFYGRDFGLNRATLDPRPDTETLVEAALALRGRDRALSLLDLGTGSGCILLTLLAEMPKASGTGVDLSELALFQAQQNAERLGLSDRARFISGDWLAAVSGRFDLILANPPYIESGAVAGLAPEVKDHDPLLALDGGADGLDAYRRIAKGLATAMAPDGLILFEIGAGQADAVRQILEAEGLVPAGAGTWPDLAGLPRCLAAKWGPGAGPAAVRRS
jgi:release factor glutamine methyltransferase